MDNTLLIVITLDCERPNAETDSLASGPPDPKSARQWTRSFAQLCDSFGYPATYFVHPELATPDAAMFREFEANGSCLGLHLHPWRWNRQRYPSELGGLDADQAREVIGDAATAWAQGFGYQPRYFRPGALSANDTTFSVLSELGFIGGAVSLPGRVFPTVFASWAGAELDPHRAHRAFRLVQGTLPLVNMPVSVDTSTLQWQEGRQFHWDLRPDFENADIAGRVRRVLTQIAARAPRVPVLNVLTHNDHDFSDMRDPVCARMQTTLHEIRDACSECGWRAQGATIADVTSAVLAYEPTPSALDPRSGKIMFGSASTQSFTL